MIVAQDGHQRGEKVIKALDAGLIDGVILSPKNKISSTMSSDINVLFDRFSDKFILFDPQLYAFQKLQDHKKLQTYPFYKKGFKDSDLTKTKLREGLVKDVVNYQKSLKLTRIVTPGVIVRAADSRGLFLNVQMQEFSAKLAIKNDLYMSVPLSESLLNDKDQVDQLLDELTGDLINVRGFYVFVEKSVMGTPLWNDSTSLAGYLYFIYALNGNGFEVITGYSGFVGLLFKLAGASYVASGWWKSLREFSTPSGWGNPKDSYASHKLLNWFFLIPDVKAIEDAGFLDDFISETRYDPPPTRGSGIWSKETSVFHFWEGLNKLINNLENISDIDLKIKSVLDRISIARAVYTQIKSNRIKLKKQSKPYHLGVWERALKVFRIYIDE